MLVTDDVSQFERSSDLNLHDINIELMFFRLSVFHVPTFTDSRDTHS